MNIGVFPKYGLNYFVELAPDEDHAENKMMIIQVLGDKGVEDLTMVLGKVSLKRNAYIDISPKKIKKPRLSNVDCLVHLSKLTIFKKGLFDGPSKKKGRKPKVNGMESIVLVIKTQFLLVEGSGGWPHSATRQP